MKNLLIALAVVSSLLVSGCYSDNGIKKEKEQNRYIMPKGMKVVNVSRQYGGNYYVFYRKMRDKEVAETYYFSGLDGGGIVTVVEEK